MYLITVELLPSKAHVPLVRISSARVVVVVVLCASSRGRLDCTHGRAYQCAIVESLEARAREHKTGSCVTRCCAAAAAAAADIQIARGGTNVV